MGFSFQGLTTQALVSKNITMINKNNVDIADVPASVEGHTSLDAGLPDEKLGANRSSDVSADSTSDEELTRVDPSAPRGVQNVQAMTYVWSKRDLILAYIMYVLFVMYVRVRCTDTSQYMVDRVRQRLCLGGQLHSRPIRDVGFPRALLDRAHRCHLIAHCRSLEAPIREDHEYLGQAASSRDRCGFLYIGPYHDCRL